MHGKVTCLKNFQHLINLTDLFYIWRIQTLLEILDIMLRGGKEGGNIGFAMVHTSETSTGRKASTFLQLLIKKGEV